jgi:Transposase DNA-binding
MGKKAGRRAVVRGEFAGIDLGDKRRESRSAFIADRLSAFPEASLPDAMRHRANLEGLYRHLNSEEVSMDELLVPHKGRTVERGLAARVAFAVADSTSYTFTGDAVRDGLGPVNESDQGFLAHVTLLISADGTRTPLGVIDVETWVRSKEDEKVEKESARWGRSMLRAAKTADGVSLIHVADRESDIYELLVKLTAEEERFILRAAQDRGVIPLNAEDATRLFEAARTSPPKYAVDVPISARKSKGNANQDKIFPVRRSRTALLSFAALTVELKRPLRAMAKLPATLKVNVVHVFELEPPAGEPPVEWLLLTSEPVSTPEEIAFVVDGYRTRWVIEEFFKATKTGCAFESKQLESYDTLTNLLAYVLVIAYALILMRTLSRTGREEPADAVLSPAQIKILHALDKNVPAKPTVRTALLAIAGLGGHLKNNGDPGWRTLSKGWRKLIDYETGYDLAVALKAKK